MGSGDPDVGKPLFLTVTSWYQTRKLSLETNQVHTTSHPVLQFLVICLGHVQWYPSLFLEHNSSQQWFIGAYKFFWKKCSYHQNWKGEQKCFNLICVVRLLAEIWWPRCHIRYGTSAPKMVTQFLMWFRLTSIILQYISYITTPQDAHKRL